MPTFARNVSIKVYKNTYTYEIYLLLKILTLHGQNF